MESTDGRNEGAFSRPLLLSYPSSVKLLASSLAPPTLKPPRKLRIDPSGGYLGNKQCKLEKIATIKRELDDFLVIDFLVINDSPYRAGLRLCQRDGRGHFDRFALLADFQDKIQPRLLSNLENDSSFNCLLEAGQLAADVVRTDRQQGNRIRAGLIGCRRTFEPRLNIPRNNHCTRYGRARWIKNTATYRCGVLLCKEQKRKNCCRHDLPPKVG